LEGKDMPDSKIRIKIDWLEEKYGGRPYPPKTRQYAANAMFSGNDDLYSIIVYLSNSEKGTIATNKYAYLGFLVEDIIRDKIEKGTSIAITEGLRKVANCVVESVHS
jgi:translation elongation factor EF-Tu-like GTPase